MRLLPRTADASLPESSDAPLATARPQQTTTASALSHYLFGGIGEAHHAIAAHPSGSAHLHAHAYESDASCCTVLMRIPPIILAQGLPSDGLQGTVRLLLEDGPERLESVLAICPHRSSWAASRAKPAVRLRIGLTPNLVSNTRMELLTDKGLTPGAAPQAQDTDARGPTQIPSENHPQHHARAKPTTPSLTSSAQSFYQPKSSTTRDLLHLEDAALDACKCLVTGLEFAQGPGGCAPRLRSMLPHGFDPATIPREHLHPDDRGAELRDDILKFAQNITKKLVDFGPEYSRPLD